jgi:hypothetical protein
MPRPSRFESIRPVTAGTDTRSAMIPVARLSTAARNIFNLTISRHEHLRPSDCVLLTAYAQTAARVLQAKGDDDERQLDKLGRLMITYGRALGIHAAQAMDRRRRKDAEADLRKPWVMDDDDE